MKDFDSTIENSELTAEERLAELKRLELIENESAAIKERLGIKEEPKEVPIHETIEYVMPANASRRATNTFPQDDAAVRELVRKHALSQIETTKRGDKKKLERIEAYAQYAADLVRLAKEKEQVPEYFSSKTGARMNTWKDFDRAAHKIQEECGILGITPMFAEIDPIV